MILDVVLIVMLVGMMLYGYKKGAVGIVANLVSVIISFILAYFLAEIVGEFISKTSFGLDFQSKITNTITNRLNRPSDSSLVLKIQETIGDAKENEIALKLGDYIFVGMGFVIVYNISRIVLWIGKKILESVFELPVLKMFNKLGGVIAATLLFIIELSIILAIIKAISSISFMNVVTNVIDSSVITKGIYDHNIITSLIFTKFIK